MLEIVALTLLLLALIAGVFDLASMAAGAVKYWRISCGILMGVLVVGVIRFLTESAAVRWIVGFFIFVALLTVGVVWEQTKGRLSKDDNADT